MKQKIYSITLFLLAFLNASIADDISVVLNRWEFENPIQSPYRVKGDVRQLKLYDVNKLREQFKEDLFDYVYRQFQDGYKQVLRDLWEKNLVVIPINKEDLELGGNGKVLDIFIPGKGVLAETDGSRIEEQDILRYALDSEESVKPNSTMYDFLIIIEVPNIKKPIFLEDIKELKQGGERAGWASYSYNNSPKKGLIVRGEWFGGTFETVVSDSNKQEEDFTEVSYPKVYSPLLELRFDKNRIRGIIPLEYDTKGTQLKDDEISGKDGT